MDAARIKLHICDIHRSEYTQLHTHTYSGLTRVTGCTECRCKDLPFLSMLAGPVALAVSYQ